MRAQITNDQITAADVLMAIFGLYRVKDGESAETDALRTPNWDDLNGGNATV